MSQGWEEECNHGRTLLQVQAGSLWSLRSPKSPPLPPHVPTQTARGHLRYLSIYCNQESPAKRVLVRDWSRLVWCVCVSVHTHKHMCMVYMCVYVWCVHGVCVVFVVWCICVVCMRAYVCMCVVCMFLWCACRIVLIVLISMKRPSLKVGNAIPGFRALAHVRIEKPSWAVSNHAFLFILFLLLTMGMTSCLMFFPWLPWNDGL